MHVIVSSCEDMLVQFRWIILLPRTTCSVSLPHIISLLGVSSVGISFCAFQTGPVDGRTFDLG